MEFCRISKLINQSRQSVPGLPEDEFPKNKIRAYGSLLGKFHDFS